MPLTHALAYALRSAMKGFTVAEIGRCFIYAGAQPDWKDTKEHDTGARETATQQWLDGIAARAPQQLDAIVTAVLEDVLGSAAVTESDKRALRVQAEKAGIGNQIAEGPDAISYPRQVEQLLDTLIRFFRRAERPLSSRRAGKPRLTLADEYDVQDLLHALLRVWFRDVRVEEWTPSYAGRTSRIDILLPEYRIAIETKVARDERHAKLLSQELEIDIAHYIAHPDVDQLWLVVYDASGYVANPRALRDLSGHRTNKSASLYVRSYIVGGHHSPPVVNE